MQQQWADLAVWEEFLKHREVRSIVELGTGYCGMSIFFLLQCIQRNVEFRTFDINPNSNLNLSLAKFLGLRSRFVAVDVFEYWDVVDSAIYSLPKPLLLFCDNGDKPRELRLFVPTLSAGDYVAVHDWPNEIKEKDVDGFPFQPIMWEECETWKSMTRFWRIK